MRSRVLLVLAAALGAVVAALLLLRLQSDADRRERSYSLSAVLQAMDRYDAWHGALPAAVSRDSSGNPLSSWRFGLVRYLTAVKRHADWHVSWNAPENSEWALRPGPHGLCLPGSRETRVYAITGPRTAFPEGDQHSLVDLPDDLVLMIEVCESKLHWMAPGDFDVREFDRKEAGFPLCAGDFCVGFADGTVLCLSARIPAAMLRDFLTIDRAKNADREVLLGEYVLQRLPPPRSFRERE